MAAASRDPGCNVQDPVAEILGFGSGELTVRQEDAGPGREVDRREAEFESGAVDAEVAGWETAEAGGIAAPEVVFECGVSAVADLQELDWAGGERGVGEELT